MYEELRPCREPFIIVALRTTTVSEARLRTCFGMRLRRGRPTSRSPYLNTRRRGWTAGPRGGRSGAARPGCCGHGARPRDVLDVNGVQPRRGLKAERAERLEVALQGHQVEPAAEFVGLLGCSLHARKYAISSSTVLSCRSTYESRNSDNQVVGVGAHPRILEVDDEQLAVMQHQVAL